MLVGASQYGSDIAIDEASQTVINLGFKNVQAQTKIGRLPVFISVVKGHNFDGTLKYNAYDWEADSNMVVDGRTVPNPRYVNRIDNNMADARAYRAEIGQDGKLYILHEVSGGNQMFRYEQVVEKDELWQSEVEPIGALLVALISKQCTFKNHFRIPLEGLKMAFLF